VTTTTVSARRHVDVRPDSPRQHADRTHPAQHASPNILHQCRSAARIPRGWSAVPTHARGSATHAWKRPRTSVRSAEQADKCSITLRDTCALVQAAHPGLAPLAASPPPCGGTGAGRLAALNFQAPSSTETTASAGRQPCCKLSGSDAAASQQRSRAAAGRAARRSRAQTHPP